MCKLKLLSEPTVDDGWTVFENSHEKIMFHEGRSQVDYCAAGQRTAYRLEDVQSLTYEVSTRSEMYHDSVRDGTYETEVWVYTASVHLSNETFQFEWEQTKYDQGIEFRLYGRSFFQNLGKRLGLKLVESGMELVPNYFRRPDYRDPDWAPPKGCLPNIMAFLFGTAD